MITSDVIPTIEEAARIFRARDTLEEYLVQGPVIKLERPEGQLKGRATIFARVEDAMRKVAVELQETDYALAVQAHREYRSVKSDWGHCEGRSLVSDRYPHQFRVCF